VKKTTLWKDIKINNKKQRFFLFFSEKSLCSSKQQRIKSFEMCRSGACFLDAKTAGVMTIIKTTLNTIDKRNGLCWKMF
jgi:phage regulator Rha-like protein